MSSAPTSLSPISVSISSTSRRTLGGRSVGLVTGALLCEPRSYARDSYASPMAHPRVEQLRFARSEWLRGLVGLNEVDAGIRFLPMNSISWMVGHMAWHERLCWMRRARGIKGERILDAFATGHPTSTPSFARM